MTNLYKEMTERHQNEYNKFSKNKVIYIFAFSNEDFEKKLAAYNLKPSDISSIGGGGFVRKNYKEELKNLFKQQKEEIQAAIKADTTGSGFIKDMFFYELANHEYLYTYDVEDTLRDLRITVQEIENSKALTNGLKLAIKELKKYED